MNTCQGCGIEIPANTKYCPLCEQKLADGTLVAREITSSPEEQEKYLCGFSWSAATTGIIYLLAMRISTVWVIIWIAIILTGSFTFGISELAAFLWLGFAGRKMAWQAENQPDFNKFRQAQNTWDKYGKMLLIIDIILAIAIVSAGISLIGPNLPDIETLRELMSEI